MLYCPDCQGNLQFQGSNYDNVFGHSDVFYCPTCHTMWRVDDPSELSEAEQALVHEALHGTRGLVIDDDDPYFRNAHD